MLRPLAEKWGLEIWEKIVAFACDEWFPSRLSFGKFKGRHYQEVREDAELRWVKAETLKFKRPPEFSIKGSAASPQAAGQ